MRLAPMIASISLVAATAAMASHSDYYMTFKAVGLDPGGPIYVMARSTGDLDGDGSPDDVVIRMECAAGAIQTAEYQIIGPRDAASGLPTGKRMHKPFTIVKEWGPASPQMMAMKAGYDIKKVEGTGARGKTMEDSWNPIALSNSEALCAAAAAAKVAKTRSNIQNN